MAKGLTPQREKFAAFYFDNGVGADAYRHAYPRSLKWKDASVHVAAAKLLAVPKVALRVQELKDAYSERNEITADGQCAKLEEIFTAHKLNPKGAGAAVSAVKHQSELSGLVVKQHKIQGHVTVQELPPLSEKAALAIKEKLEAEKF